MTPSNSQAWTGQLALRIRRLLILKFVGISVFTWLFFVAYFHLLRHPAYPSTVMPLTALDHLIAFQPQALYAYLTLWVYVGISPGLQLTFTELVVYGLWIGALCLTGLTLFYFWPTEVPRLTIDVSGFAGFGLLKGVDAAGNACPSMHVAVAVFSAMALQQILRQVGVPAVLRAVNWIWFAAIVFSTLAIKQHVVLDAVAGLVLGMAFAFAFLKWRPGARRISDALPATDIIDHQRSWVEK